MHFSLLSVFFSLLFLGTLAQTPVPLPRKPVVGNNTKILVVSCGFLNNPRKGGDNAPMRVAEGVAEFFQHESMGKLNLIPAAFNVDVNFTTGQKNEAKAYISSLPQWKGYKHRAIIWGFGHSASVGNLPGLSVGTANHEFGHALGMGHTGSILPSKLGLIRKKQNDPSGDVMTSIVVGGLNVPHLFYMGWLEPQDTIFMEFNKTYVIRNRRKRAELKNVKTAVTGLAFDVPNTNRRVWLSCTGKGEIALHYVTKSAQGGSTFTGAHTSNFTDESGLVVDIVSLNMKFCTINVNYNESLATIGKTPQPIVNPDGTTTYPTHPPIINATRKPRKPTKKGTKKKVQQKRK